MNIKKYHNVIILKYLSFMLKIQRLIRKPLINVFIL